MKTFSRRGFLSRAVAAAACAVPADAKPYTGRTMVVVTAHADDFTIFAGGTIIKMIDEGYTTHLFRVSNDEKDSYDLDVGETSRRNTAEMRTAADLIGIKDVYSLDFRNDEMDPIPETEVRARLIYLFRKLRPWTIFTFDPSAKYEENPDHKKTARATEDAAWTSQGHLFLPEHFSQGLTRWTVVDRFYWARQLDEQGANKIVDITPTIERKIRAIQAHKTMMQHTAYSLKEKLEEANLRLPLLDSVDEYSINRLINIQVRERASAVGAKHGMKYAEEFHYVPIAAEGSYVMKNAVPLN